MAQATAPDAATDPAASSPDLAVDARGVTVRYGDLVAVDGVDLTVHKGEIVGVIGPNGAGKTSLLECVEGLRTPSAGRIRVVGLDPFADRAALAATIGVQLQHTSYPTRVKVGELCRLFAGFYPRPDDYQELLARFDLSAQADSQVTKLSGGQQQRLSLVLALLGRPSLVFLDELTTGLDPVARRVVWEGLRRRNQDGLTIVLTSHYMDEVEYLCDRVAMMVRGRIVAMDTVAGLIQAHIGQTDRLVAEDVGADPAVRAELAGLGATVRVTPAGNRLLIDVDGAAARHQVDAILAARRIASRAINPSMEDVYLTLVGEDSGVGGEQRDVR
jgi:ABC-2 type transport system ATP-binding protein